MNRTIYFFGSGRADGSAEMKDLLGGKGANLAEMSRMGLPVPPGFTISTDVCRLYYRARAAIDVIRAAPSSGSGARAGQAGRELKGTFKRFLRDFEAAASRLEKALKKRLGDAENPLLVSVRSGAKFSMPGMMDTILNLGLNDRAVMGLARQTQDERFAWDSYRRFIQMFGNVVLGIEKDRFEEELKRAKRQAGVENDFQLKASDMRQLAQVFKEVFRKSAKRDFPQDPRRQLRMAVEAVFKSWMNLRAQTYRKLNRIPDDLGTACTVQAMVFGNRGATSVTGVGFTRSPSSGEDRLYGEYLPNAQGEDVVAGTRTPKPLADMARELPATFRELTVVAKRLEKHYRDMQDFEFTVERGRLYMLQTRAAKRTAIAALRAAVDMVGEGLITEKEALLRVSPEQLDQLLRPVFDPKARKSSRALAQGLPAGPGAASGRIAFSAERAVDMARSGPVILVRPETSPDDIAGMAAAQGILTAAGGMTSHAAVVGRGLGKVCVVGCTALQISEHGSPMRVGKSEFVEGDYISLDGFTGEVLPGEVPTVQSEVLRSLSNGGRALRGSKTPPLAEAYRLFMRWVDEHRRLGVRANADQPEDARVAIALGAEGVGLCRTEHMFFAEDRIPKVIRMIIAKSAEERRQAIEALFPLQKEDFKGIFKAMKGLPVTIRLLDPPLHEFLPRTHFQARQWAKGIGLPLARIWKASLELREQNPMLGHRGCRLGISYPEITEMQARAVFAAALELKRERVPVQAEIMIPLVGNVTEFRHQKEIVVRVAEETFKRAGSRVPYKVGTMIEVPRACLVAGYIAKEAEFFSFGTNDLTQMTLGLSRDDYSKYIHTYIESKIWLDDPFLTLDQAGVGKLMQTAVAEGRKVKRNLKIGICGEHGGDPRSVAFCHRAKLDYVSCSPYRVPVARLAAAQAAVQADLEKPGLTA